MMETAVVFGRDCKPLYWHEPKGRTSGSLPDDRALWEILFKHREKGGTGKLVGVAHTHPWEGPAWPSQTDLTTFRAVEQGLGQTLIWPVVTFTDVVVMGWNGHDYVSLHWHFNAEWLTLLRRLRRRSMEDINMKDEAVAGLLNRLMLYKEVYEAAVDVVRAYQMSRCVNLAELDDLVEAVNVISKEITKEKS